MVIVQVEKNDNYAVDAVDTRRRRPVTSNTSGRSKREES